MTPKASSPELEKLGENEPIAVRLGLESEMVHEDFSLEEGLEYVRNLRRN